MGKLYIRRILWWHIFLEQYLKKTALWPTGTWYYISEDSDILIPAHKLIDIFIVLRLTKESLWVCIHFSSVQLLSSVRLFVTPRTTARQASLSITNSWSPPKPMSIESLMPSNHFILSFPSLFAFNGSQHQGLLKWVSSLHQVAKVFQFQLQHQSYQWTPMTALLLDGLVGSPCSPRTL